MDELVKMRDELNAKTDALNNEIHNVEGIMNKLNLGVSAKIEISKDQWLAYGKLEVFEAKEDAEQYAEDQRHKGAWGSVQIIEKDLVTGV